MLTFKQARKIAEMLCSDEERRAYLATAYGDTDAE